ncbi:MAG: chemotaxis protein CheD [Euryarchaeota archaeon]|nr:chemotaxis protein CheD [Euryarchaeota archaeon]
MNETYTIGIGEYRAAHNPCELVTIGLGSCVGIALYDSRAKVGGLSHVMLPDSTQARNTNPGKFADTAIPLTIHDMMDIGARKLRTIAKIAGGAHMFSGIKGNTMNIGERNIAAVKKKLTEEHIKIVAEDLGGSNGRTLRFDLVSGKVLVKTVRGVDKEL